MKKNLIEYLTTEGQQKDKDVTVIWQKADTINSNGRIYPRNILEKEIKRINSKISSGETVYGQAFHPEDGFGRADKLSHEWKKIWMEKDGTCKGIVSLLDTDVGKDIKAILGNGRKLGISSRGLGSTVEKEIDGKKVKLVGDDFKLLSPGDWVIAPSVQGAGNIQESLVLMEEKMNAEDEDKEPDNISLFTEEELTEVLKSQYEKEVAKNSFFGSWEEWRLKNENYIREKLGFEPDPELAEKEKTYQLYTEAKLAGWSGTLEEFKEQFPQKYGEKAVQKLEEKAEKKQKSKRVYKPKDVYLESLIAGIDPDEMARRLNEKEGLVVEEKKEQLPVKEKINNLRKKYKPSIYDWQEDDDDEQKKFSMVWEQIIAGPPKKKN